MNFNAYKERISAFKARHGIGRRQFQAARLMAAPVTRSYPAGALNRLTADWQPSTATGDSEVRFDIESLRDRSRQLERAHPLMKRFLSVLEKNVLKSGVGFSFQNKAKFMNGEPDRLTNEKIEMAWREWTRPGNCTLTGEESFYDICRLALRSAARDGGILVRKIVDPKANRFGFTLQLLEIDHLDVNHNRAEGDGNRIIMGVEKDGNYKTVAYHILKAHPGDMLFGSRQYQRMRVPAREIIHYFVKERVTQCVGVPWAAPSMLRMHHLEQYELSEIIASRAASNKGGYFTSDRGQAYIGEDEVTQTELGAEKTGTLNDSEPGQYDELPAGMTFVPYNPTHPTQQFGDFVRDANLSICSGLDVSYATLVGDLTRSSFSSMRTGWLDERETYAKMQAHIIEHLVVPIFEAWLMTAITSGAISLPMTKLEQASQPNFRGRRWPWIDPQKDIEATIMEVDAGFRTRDAVIDNSDSELDLEETFTQLQYEHALAKKMGLNFAKDKAAKPDSKEADPEENGEMKPVPRHNGHRIFS